VEEPVHEQDQVSTTDPDSTYATKGGTPARLGYYDNYLVDNDSCVIVGVQATAARMSQETVAAQDMLTGLVQRQGREPESLAADTTYGNGEFLQWLLDRGITPYMRTRDNARRKNNPGYGRLSHRAWKSRQHPRDSHFPTASAAAVYRTNSCRTDGDIAIEVNLGTFLSSYDIFDQLY